MVPTLFSVSVTSAFSRRSRNRSASDCLMRRDIPGDLGCADDRAGVVAYRRDGQRDVDAPAILGDPHRLEVLDPLALSQPSQDLVFLGLPFRRNQHANRAVPTSSSDGIAKQTLGGRVARLNDAVQVFRDDRVVGRVDNRRQVRLRRERLLLLGNVAEIADDAEPTVGQRDAIEPPLVELLHPAIDADFDALGCEVRLAGLERVPEDPDDFIRVVRFPQDVDDLVEIAADDAAWNVAEDRERDGVDVTNAKVRIHDVDADGRLVQERLILLAAITQGALGLPPHPRELKLRRDGGAATRAR